LTDGQGKSKTIYDVHPGVEIVKKWLKTANDLDA
jgi:hypothetical protein